jgi:hypothetical protein
LSKRIEGFKAGQGQPVGLSKEEKMESKIFGGNMEEKNLKRAQWESPEPLLLAGG